ncbi:MAG: TonB-dependent receptor [Tannerella sp.]|jgi:TonB-linked SusC/RagA family outer membrane protein|nr:TonB-dependent receptor [Tannerella sp.]
MKETFIFEKRKTKILMLRMKTMRTLILAAALMTSIQVYAQTSKVIKGTVSEAGGEPVAGATVSINGTTVGTATNIDGNFTLTLPANVPANATLTVSYIGYVTQTLPIGRETSFNITLEEDLAKLDEVVVIGYGTQKKATLTGAISTVSNKEIAVTKNENVVNMLAGKMPGVRISQLSSRPGEFATKIDIRGMGTPLVVVDGITRDVGFFSRLDANEIESVSVLKDASAAIYGLRSANGVILVTTKRGSSEAGKFNVTYSTNYGWQKFLYVPDNVDAVQWMQLTNEKKWRDFNANYMNRQPADYEQSQIDPYINGTKQTYDWMGALFNETTPQYQHNVSIDGGTDKVNYFFNLSFLDQKGALKTDAMNYNRWNFRSNVDANITNRLKVSVSLGGYMDEMNEPNMDIWTTYKYAWLMRPIVPIYANDNPEYLNGYLVGDVNPVAITNPDIAGYRNNVARVFNSNLAITYKIPYIDGLSATASYSYNFKYQENTNYSKYFYLYNYNSDTQTYEPTLFHGNNGANNYIRKQAYPDYKRLMNLRLDYQKTFLNVHNVTALLGFEEEYSYWDNFYASRQSNLDIPYLFAGSANEYQVGSMDGSLGDNSARAFLGRLAYDYAGKYMLEYSFRYDGTSKFPVGKRFALFSSYLAAWRISEERFIKENFGFIDNLKLRATYGILGDDMSASNYPPDIVGYQLSNSVGYIFNGNFTQGVNPTAIPNPDLTWYTSKTMNLGVDIETMNGLLGGSFEYFIRNRDGLLATSQNVIPGTVGADLPQENLNSDRTFGYEFTITHRNRISDFNYYINGQFGTTRNMWRSHLQEPANNSYDKWRNRDSDRYQNIWWGREYAGQFQNYDQIYHHTTSVGSGTVPGDYYYEDWNGDGFIDSQDDHPIALNGMPWVNYGITLGAEWRGFDLNANFQGSAFVYTRYTEALVEPLSFGGAGTMKKFLDRWHPVDPNADYFDPNTQWISGYYPVTGSPLADGTRAIEDASYLRLKTLELGYNLPDKVLEFVGCKGLRLYVSGYNVLTFTNLKNSDPEHPGSEGGASNEYVDTYKYPINTSLNFGASIKF